MSDWGKIANEIIKNSSETHYRSKPAVVNTPNKRITPTLLTNNNLKRKQLNTKPMYDAPSTALPPPIVNKPTVGTGKWGTTILPKKSTTPTVEVGKTGSVKIVPRQANGVDSLVAGFTDSATLGTLNGLTNKFTGNKTNMNPTNNNFAYGAGKMLGYTIPYGAASKALKPAIGAIKNPLLRSGARIAEGATTFGIGGAIEGKANGKTNQEILKEAKFNALLGGGFGLAGETIKGIKALKEIKSQGIKNAFENKINSNNKILQPNSNLRPIVKFTDIGKEDAYLSTFKQPQIEVPKVETPQIKPFNIQNANGKLKPQIVQMKSDTLPLAQRDFKNVGDKKVNAYQFDNPTLKPYISQEANILKGELERTLKPTRGANNINGESIGYGNKRITSDSMAVIKDTTGASYEKINKALDNIIVDHGKENNALSKRVELIIDDRLTNGYVDDTLGQNIPKHGEYLQEKQFIDNMPQQLNTSTFKKPQSKIITSSANMDSTPNNNFGSTERFNATHTPEGVDFSGKPAKVSKVYSNTLQNTDTLSKVEKNMLDQNDFKYDPKTEQMSLDNARARINNDINGEIKNLNAKEVYTGEDVDTMFGILGDKLLPEAQASGNNTEVKNWLKNIRKAGTTGGQEVQSFAKYSRTGEGKLIEMQRVVDKVEDNLKKVNPTLIDGIDKQTKEVIDTLNTAHKEAITETAKTFETPTTPKTKGNLTPKLKTPKVELLPSQILAKKIQNTVNPKTPQEKSMINKMISELYGVAKESPIEGGLTNKLKPLNDVADALNNREHYAITWTNAKEIVKAQFKDNPEALAILNDYFEKGIKPPFSMSKFNSAYNQGAKELKINMSDIVKNYYKTGTETKQGLIDYLVKESKLTGDEAKTLANTIDTKFRTIKKQKSEEYLLSVFKDKNASVKNTNKLSNIEALSNTGAFVNDNYKNKVAERLTPELRKLIGFNPKGTVAKVVDESIMSFEDIVKGGVGKIGTQRTLFLKSLEDNLKVNPKDAATILKAAEEEFNSLTKTKQTQILNNMFKEKAPVVKKSVVDKVMELINLEAYDKQSIRDLIKAKEGLPLLESSDIKFITDNMEKYSNAIPDSYEQRMRLAKVGKLIANKTPSTGIEKLQAAQRISMLFNTKSTVTRNPLGNTLLGTLEGVKKNTFGIPLDIATTKLRNIGFAKQGKPLVGRTQLFNPLGDLTNNAKGAKQGVKEWLLDIKNNVDTSPVGGGVELPTKTNIFNEEAKNPIQRSINIAANKIHAVVGRALKLGDTPFFNAAYAERIGELKRLNKTNIITDAMKQDAHLFGLERTLQNDSAMSSMFRGLKKGNFNGKHKGAELVYQVVATLELPFASTPGNILDKFIDYGPGGILKATGHALYTHGKGTFNQKKFVDVLARGMTGTGLAVAGFFMAKNGYLTGARDKDNKIEGTESALGKANYAYKIGNEYTTIDWALPASAPLMMGADFYNSSNKGKGFSQSLIDGAGSGVNLMFNSTLLQGPSRALGGYNPATSISNSLMGTTTQAVPTLLNQARQLSDVYKRETYSDNKVQQTVNKLVNRIPFASKTLPRSVDVFGNDVKLYQGKNSVGNVMFSPAFKTTYNPTPTQQYAMDIYKNTGSDAAMPIKTANYITFKGDKISLTSEENISLQKNVASQTLKALEMLRTQGEPANDATAAMMQGLITSIKTDEQNKILNNRGISTRIPKPDLEAKLRAKEKTENKAKILEHLKIR